MKSLFITFLWVTNVFLELVAVLAAAYVVREMKRGALQMAFMIAACVLSFICCIVVTYKEQANNSSKLNISCLLCALSPFLLVDGIAFGVYIGSKTRIV